QIEFGFMAWDTTHTLALLDRNHMLPLSVEEIDARSHVFVLPLSADEWYGEYAYTGGLLGGEAVTGKVRGVRSATLFALPPGSRVCSTSFLENIPCGGT
ncbi:MAG: hypothetical protein U1C71_03325, partial [archaeon]|nr:hypothetical protein [archaeon]